MHGTGWLALDRYVVTCAHVVDDALERERGSVDRPEDPIRLDLPFLGKTDLVGRVVAWFPWRPLSDLVREPLADIAVLELQGDVKIAGGIDPGMVDRRIPARESRFLTYGFPTGFDNGTEASGEVLVQDPGGWLQVRDTQDYGYFIQQGFSGAPVVSQADLRLIAMATAADRDRSTRLAFLLPAHLICRAFPPLARPYRGLSAFGEEEEDLFFGRDGFVDQLQTKLTQHPFAAVIGPSGSGKSSVVLAGLVPRLRAQGWNIAVCRPLRDPLLQLGLGLASLTHPNAADFSARLDEAEKWADRLRKDPGRIVDLARQVGGATAGQTRTLVVIDQFEELFTQDAETPDGAVSRKAETNPQDGSPRQAQFLAVLEVIAMQAPDSSPIRAVATMRVDFMGHALAIRRLATLLQDTDVKLGPMTTSELNEAIRRPARTFGVEFEDGLAEELVTAMQGKAGGLPLLEFTLDRLWRRQGQRKLTWAAYRGPDGKGGLETALDEHAEDVLRKSGAPAEAGVRRVMLRLVRLGDDGAPDARAVVHRSEIGEADWPVVQKLAEERLLTIGSDAATGEETAEVVHEALIGAWTRLRGWLVEDRDFGLWRQRLDEGLETWSSHGKDDDLLLRGRLLTEASDWLANRGTDLNDHEANFIKASQQHAQHEAEEELRQAQEREKLANDLADTRGRALQEAEAARTQQKRTNAWLQALVALLTIALSIGAYFYRDNLLQREAAETARYAAEKAAVAEEEARASAVQAAATAKKALLQAEAAAREAKGRQLGAEALGIQRDLQGSESAERASALAIEGWRRFPAPPAYQAAVTALRELPQHHIEHGGTVHAVAFSPKGDLLATASFDNTARLIRTADGSEVARIEHDGKVNAVAFSPNGDLLATGSADGSARLIRIADGSEMARFRHRDRVNALAFSPNGDLLATASADNTARLIRTADGSEAARMEHDADVNAVAFNPKGDLLATASGDNTARLIRTADGSEVARIEHGADVNAVAFSPNGDLLATASDDKSARLIRTADGSEMARFRHRDRVNALAFSPNGDLLATASADNTARLIRTADGSEVARIEHIGTVLAVAFSPNGDLLATASFDNTARLIRTADGSEVARIEHGADINAVAFSPNGDLLATASDDKSARLIRTADDSEVARIAHDSPVYAVAFSPKGDLLATASGDNTARLIRTTDASEVARIEHDDTVLAIAFSPNGDLLATGSADGSARLIRTTNGSEVARIEHADTVLAIAFSPNGDLLATASFDNTARLIRTADGSEVARIEHGNSVWSVAFSPSGNLLATASDDGTARLIHAANGSEATRIDHENPVTNVAFSPDGIMLATAIDSDENTARLIRVVDGGEVARIEHIGTVYAVAFSPKGELLATAGGRTARLIRTVDGSEVARIEHGNSVWAVAFNPSGDLLATASDDGIARLVRTADGNEVARIEHGTDVNAVAFSPNGDLLATASDDKSARLLFAPERVFEKLCRERVGRNLSAEEWQRHIGPVQNWAPTCPEWSSDPELLTVWKEKQAGGAKR